MLCRIPADTLEQRIGIMFADLVAPTAPRKCVAGTVQTSKTSLTSRSVDAPEVATSVAEIAGIAQIPDIATPRGFYSEPGG
jgi:hypothetical protein